MPKFLPTSEFKWIVPKEFDLNEYTINTLKGCVFEVDLNYPKELQEIHNDYLLAPDKIEIKRQMLSEYQLKVADLYKTPIDNVKKLVPIFFDREKYVLYYATFLEARNRSKKIHRVLEFNQSQWLKPYIEFNTKRE